MKLTTEIVDERAAAAQDTAIYAQISLTNQRLNDKIETSSISSYARNPQSMAVHPSDTYSDFTEETNRTETDKIKKDLPREKLKKLALIETKFKEQIRNFDKTEICTICQYTYNECSSRLIHLKCDHYYHERCFVVAIACYDLDEWKCLICRADAVTGLKERIKEPEVQDPFGRLRKPSMYVRCMKCSM